MKFKHNHGRACEYDEPIYICDTYKMIVTISVYLARQTISSKALPVRNRQTMSTGKPSSFIYICPKVGMSFEKNVALKHMWQNSSIFLSCFTGFGLRLYRVLSLFNSFIMSNSLSIGKLYFTIFSFKDIKVMTSVTEGVSDIKKMVSTNL